MKDTLQHIISSIVTNPTDVTVTESEEEGITTFTVSVSKEDMGKVIGKEGKVIRSIRNVMKIPAIKQNKRINVSLAENE
jgi:uncharacterized protein